MDTIILNILLRRMVEAKLLTVKESKKVKTLHALLTAVRTLDTFNFSAEELRAIDILSRMPKRATLEQQIKVLTSICDALSGGPLKKLITDTLGVLRTL